MLLVQEAIYTVNPGSAKDERKIKERLVMSEVVDEEDADPGKFCFCLVD